MTTRPPLTVWLLGHFDASGPREALIGDVIEEIARGRSRWWTYQQVIALAVVTIAAHAKHHTHLSVPLFMLSVGSVFLCGLSGASLGRVLVAWSGVYMVAGTMSLVGHVITSRFDVSCSTPVVVANGTAPYQP